MMIKKKSNPWARLKYLYILPLAAASVAAFARPEVSNSLDEISSAKVSDLASIMKADGEKSVENLLLDFLHLSAEPNLQVFNPYKRQVIFFFSLLVWACFSPYSLQLLFCFYLPFAI